MKGKQQNTVNVKIILICFFFLFLFLFLFLVIMRSTFPYPHSLIPNSTINQEPHCPNKCTKIPSSLSNALVHYATSNTTPQQTLQEISVSLKVLQNKSPCNFLVFGLGHDSLMWTSLNHGGHTVFLEEDESWIRHVKEEIPSLESYHVVYDTKRPQADQLHEIGMQEHCKQVGDPRFSKCQLALKSLPSLVYETQWDVIMVDAPTGYHDGAPGRMSAIYTAGLMARNKVNGLFGRAAREDQAYFNLPSHKSSLGTPFCPSA
ncbi:Glucuronoxylan 4-O-methyltransferase 2 [Salvia divinorum]|uniref:Glucuronoxylan 4-O-methyltransferase 2 n=1 Tax=Salvia divinorum TaxID=28513 RepID=A0ABD1FGK6_SALDI